jgi:hypothetical protein
MTKRIALVKARCGILAKPKSTIRQIAPDVKRFRGF